jgi:hypothetical protein
VFRKYLGTVNERLLAQLFEVGFGLATEGRQAENNAVLGKIELDGRLNGPPDSFGMVIELYVMHLFLSC